MRKAFLMMLLAVASTSAAAAWFDIGSDKTTTVYADPATIRREGNIAQMWHLLDFKTARIAPGPKRYRYLSSKSHNEYDCDVQLTRVLLRSWYSGHMGKGYVVYRSHKHGRWEPVPPESAAELLWRTACEQIVIARRQRF